MLDINRDDLVTALQQMNENYATLDDRIQDIRIKQGSIVSQQTEILDLLYVVDREAGKSTCPACYALLDQDVTICPNCGEILGFAGMDNDSIS